MQPNEDEISDLGGRQGWHWEALVAFAKALFAGTIFVECKPELIHPCLVVDIRRCEHCAELRALLVFLECIG